MVSWKCSKCGKAFYSMWERSDQRTVKCPDCGADVENPYYQKQQEERTHWLQRVRELEEVLKEVSDYFAYRCRNYCPFSLCAGRRCDLYPIQRKVRQVLLEELNQKIDCVKKLEVVAQAARAFLDTIDLAERTGAKVDMPPVQWRALYKLREVLDESEGWCGASCT